MSIKITSKPIKAEFADMPNIGDIANVRFDGLLQVTGYSKQPDFWRIHLKVPGSSQPEAVSFTVDQFRRFRVQ